jgi:hypothetical protein
MVIHCPKCAHAIPITGGSILTTALPCPNCKVTLIVQRGPMPDHLSVTWQQDDEQPGKPGPDEYK